jgi:tripartite-type tricarboxylate transporter receptor subunit TctC
MRNVTYNGAAAIFFFLTSALAATAGAQESFYSGKTIRLIVGLSAGGGYDVYSRTIARHLGKRIPGNPSVVVEKIQARYQSTDG